MQPVQLSLLPEQVPAPPSQLARQLPEPVLRAARQVLAGLIVQAMRPAPSAPGGAESRDE